MQISFVEALNGTKNLLVKNTSLEVVIPQGMIIGLKIRITNKVNILNRIGERGDLLVEISEKTHPIWEVKGLDIYADLPISF